MTMWGEKGTLKGRWWKLANGNWAGRNNMGTQTTFKIQVEAQRFAEKEILTEAQKKLPDVYHLKTMNKHGKMESVASIVADMQSKGTDQKLIDRWLQGLTLQMKKDAAR